MSKNPIIVWFAVLLTTVFILPTHADECALCDLFDQNPQIEFEQGFIRGIELNGRYQGQYITQEEDIGSEDNDFDDWQNRRARLSLSIDMDYGLNLFAEVNVASWLQDQEGPFVDTFQDLYLKWKDDSSFVRVGKQKQLFTIEDATSSKRIRTIERSAIVNETAGARPWGAVYGFDAGGMKHMVGGWLYGAEASAPEFVDLDDSNGGFSYNGTYELNDLTDVKFDYVYADNDGGNEGSEGDAANGFGPAYEHAFALGTITSFNEVRVEASAIVAMNREGSGDIPAGNDTWGFYVTPSYDLTDKLELVGRYAYMDEGREQRTQRFDERVEVENYHTVYGGLQYKICGDKLKLLGGYEYATGDLFESNTDIDTGSLQLGVRTYF